MNGPSNIPRRAWQRRNLRRDSVVAGSSSAPKSHKQAWKPQIRGWQRSSGQERGDETDSAFGSSLSSNSESDSEFDGRAPRRMALAARSCRSQKRSNVSSADSDSGSWSDSCSDIDADSGYGSIEQDLDDTADFYDDLLAKFEIEGPTLADHGDNTKKMIQEQEQKWYRFCKHRKVDPTETIKQCNPALFKLYLVWRVRNSRIKKESTVMTYWKVLSLIYSNQTASWMREDVLYDVRNWIHTYLTPTYGLDTTKKEKAGIFVEDLAVLLNHHWIRDEEVFAHERLRVQLAANLILAGATATRPGALIGQLCYEHLEFQLFPPLKGDQRPRVVLKVNLERIKRSGGKSEPREFAFREDDMLLYDPLILIMALSFADNAFLNEFKNSEEIYKLIVPPNSDRIRLRWKGEWLKRPIFRDVELSDGMVQVSLTKALQYRKERHHLIRLGRSIGLAKALEWYDLRRGSGKKLNEELTAEERNKIMGHRQGDSRVYVMYYMSTFIDADCQSICFGSAPQHDLVHLAGRLLRHGDAPTALTDQQKFEVNQDPKLVKYRQKRTRALQQWKWQGYRSREEAEGTDMASRYDHYKKKADCLGKRLKAERLQRAIKDFHDLIHVEEVNRQLNGVKPSSVLVPPTVKYELPERAQVAHLFSKAADSINRDRLHKLRMQLLGIFAIGTSNGNMLPLVVLITTAYKFWTVPKILPATLPVSMPSIYRQQ
ncbi:hypothetical protein DL764_009563 [Monosporascus ibericus]|uniref:Uncharacterized protein n=1 Tax=Monosporascus ibericus TaxID=155417 RepID=A0A4Q4SXJ9_9PEZI|nr:hypothetical protein DL764_009563 [Monosporascus ibericus]